MVSLYARYQPTRGRRWRVRFLIPVILLGVGIAWWLSWKPRSSEETRRYLRPANKGVTVPSIPAPARSVPRDRRPPPAHAANRERTPKAAALPPAPPPETLNSAAGLAGWPARPVQTLLEAQIALARLALSPGSIDGVAGSRTRNALRAFQQQQGLRTTGELDAATKSRLLLTEPPYTNCVVTAEDLARLLPVGATWLEKSRQPRLDYETIVELFAERSQSDPDLVRQKNQDVSWTNLTAGMSLLIPNVNRPAPTNKAAFVRIQLADRTLQAFDERTNLIAHFPCSIARSVDKRPVGELHVASIVANPNYTFDPANFPHSAEARQLNAKLVIPPGPNNPVGVAWIGLDREGYGIHGTPKPEQVGQAESLGCFRLANWNAEYLERLAWIGMPVYVEP